MFGILRGDDTDFQDLRTITVVLKPVPYDVSKCTADFTLCKQRIEIENVVVNQPMPVVFPHEKTAKMTCGINVGVFRIKDEKGRICTVDSSIRVLVSDDVEEVYGLSRSVTITASMSYNALIDKPKLNGVEIKGDKGIGLYGLVGTVNGYQPDENGRVRIPNLFVTDEPPDIEAQYQLPPTGFIEFDQIFCKTNFKNYVMCKVDDWFRWIEQKSELAGNLPWSRISNKPMDGEKVSIRTDDELRETIAKIIGFFGGTVKV